MIEKFVGIDSSTVKMHTVWKIFWAIMIIVLLAFWVSVALA